MEAQLRTASEAEDTIIREDWGALNWLASQAIGNTQGVTLGRVTIKLGERNPCHAHLNGEEVLYLISGQLSHCCGDRWVTVKAGDTLVLPAGVSHCALNRGDVDADMIVAYSTRDRDFQPVADPPERD